MMKLIKTNDELFIALKRIDELTLHLSTGNDTLKDELDILTLVVEDYENKNWEQKALSPQDFLVTYLEESGRNQTDLAKLLGAQSRASEIISGKRELSKAQIKKLCEEWGLPAAPLLGINLLKAA